MQVTQEQSALRKSREQRMFGIYAPHHLFIGNNHTSEIQPNLKTKHTTANLISKKKYALYLLFRDGISLKRHLNIFYFT